MFPLSFRRWYELGGWDEDDCAIAITQGDDIIANVSLQRMTIVLRGRKLTGWQLAAVGVVPEERCSRFFGLSSTNTQSAARSP